PAAPAGTPQTATFPRLPGSTQKLAPRATKACLAAPSVGCSAATARSRPPWIRDSSYEFWKKFQTLSKLHAWPVCEGTESKSPFRLVNRDSLGEGSRTFPLLTLRAHADIARGFR